MTLKAGEFYFRACFDEDTGRVSLEPYGCRVVRKGRAFMTPKIADLTWGKRSRKTGDFGWLPNTPRWMISRVPVDDRTFSQSKTAALRGQLAVVRARAKRWKGDAEVTADIDREIAALERALKRASARA